MSPLPLSTPFEGAGRDPISSGSVAAYGGGGGGVFVQPSAGGGLRGAYQVTRDVSAGGEVAFGARVTPGDSSPAAADYLWLTAGRAHLRINPVGEHFGLVFGAGGGGMNNGLGFVATDAGVVGSVNPHGVVEFYGGGSVGVSVPVTSQASASTDLQSPQGPLWTSFSVRADVGVLFRPHPRVALGIDGTGVLAATPFDQGVFFAAIASARFTFGGPTPTVGARLR